MSLKDVAKSGAYDNSTSLLNEEILDLCLSHSSLYDRGVGFFSSGWLRDAAKGMSKFAEKGGKARWIASPKLTQEDWDALQKGNEAITDDAIRLELIKSIRELKTSMETDTLNALAWLVADGVIEFRLAKPRGRLERGDFHDKFGTFYDEHGNVVSFNGSINDSIQGNRNYESISVFCEWDGEQIAQFSAPIRKRFKDLWDNKDPNVEVYTLPDAAKAELLELRTSDQRPYKKPKTDRRPVEIQQFREPQEGWLTSGLREYQKTAIRKWGANGGKGIFAMATGTGKTLTALSAAMLYGRKNPEPLAVVVVCPYVNLCIQWEKDIAAFGINPVSCYDDKDSWIQDLSNEYESLKAGAAKHIVIVTTNRTLQGTAFQEILRNMACNRSIRHMIIADEMHNLGTDKLLASLPSEIELRIGLSATPERHNDEESSAELVRYFGEIVFEFPLSQAIQEGHLTTYNYYPVVVELSDEEAASYRDLSEQISAAWIPDRDKQSNFLKMLLIRRARLTASAKNKITKLNELLSGFAIKPKQSLFYCGDGTVSDDDGEYDGTRQIEAVLDLLGNKHHMKVAKFTYEEDSDEREAILKAIKANELDGVVAIRCLDEGIDLPDLRHGFILASSTNPRQFIQRRGRLLRRAPGKTTAEIYDFVVAPPEGDGTDKSFNWERRMFRTELARIEEFCTTALNGNQARSAVNALRVKYNLLGSTPI